MPTLSFDPQFRAPILEGRKTHTIRAAIPRGFAIGAWVPLYTGMRTRHCALIGSGKMNRVHEVSLNFDVGIADTGAMILADMRDLDAFAVSDGFTGWAAMEAFWALKHKRVRQFTGWLLGWGEFTTDHRLGATSDDPSRAG